MSRYVWHLLKSSFTNSRFGLAFTQSENPEHDFIYVTCNKLVPFSYCCLQACNFSKGHMHVFCL